MPIGFAWDNEKAARNIRDHEGVTFAQAAAAFHDPFAVEWIDEREDYGEERSILLGMIGGQLLYVVYTERGETIRIIAARRQRAMNKTSTCVTMQSDGTLIRMNPDGTEEKLSVSPPSPLSDEAITAAALRDPDAQPLTDADLSRMQRIPRAKTLRRALGLTQEEFSIRYRIPLGTLRDWEQGRCEPDQPSRAYLTVIAHDPEGVQRALQVEPH